MPAVIMTVFHPIIGAILITGVFAAMISTANSLLILSATEISETIVKYRKKNKSSISDLALARIITTVLSIAAFTFAIMAKENMIYNIVKYVWAGIGDTFSVVIILSLFWKKYHSKAAFITIISGIIFTVIWIQTPYEEYISCLVLTFVVSMIAAVVSTYSFKR